MSASATAYAASASSSTCGWWSLGVTPLAGVMFTSTPRGLSAFSLGRVEVCRINQHLAVRVPEMPYERPRACRPGPRVHLGSCNANSPRSTAGFGSRRRPSGRADTCPRCWPPCARVSSNEWQVLAAKVGPAKLARVIAGADKVLRGMATSAELHCAFSILPAGGFVVEIDDWFTTTPNLDP